MGQQQRPLEGGEQQSLGLEVRLTLCVQLWG